MIPLLRAALIIPLALILGYVSLILILTTPWLQRQALYAHNVGTIFYHNVSNPEIFGFAKHQVVPFNLSTPDHETLFGWHVLPLDSYAKQQDDLAEKTPSSECHLDVLRSDPEARIVINFHGNAGHVAQGWRTDTYHRLASLPHLHIFTIDYRGFGLSTGAPDEAGLIADGVALVNYVLEVTRVPPERIVILGQSLGTAVASAVSLHFADPGNALIPYQGPGNDTSAKSLKGELRAVFAGIVLVAPFFNLPNLLLTYRIGGILPLLAPLRPYPFLQAQIAKLIPDKWPSAERLLAYAHALDSDHSLNQSRSRNKELGSLQLIHSFNDRDISFRQSVMIFNLLSNDSSALGNLVEDRPRKEVHVSGGGKGVRISAEFVEHGGHNRIVTWSNVALGVMRAFDGR